MTETGTVERAELAEVNVARMRHPLEDPGMSSFRDAIAVVNLLAERSPGFVWRLAVPGGGHLAGDRLLGAPGTIVNLSVWSDYESLHAFTYRGLHGRYLSERERWFERLPGMHTALWWVPAGHEPTAEEGVNHLRYLQKWGPTARAFTVLTRFDADGRPVRSGRYPHASSK
jgi:hypothetical protein